MIELLFVFLFEKYKLGIVYDMLVGNYQQSIIGEFIQYGRN